MRREEKQVMITWPTGHKDGPYTQTYEDFEGDVEIEIGDRTVIIPAEWTEDVEPELKEGRLYYAWDNWDGSSKIISTPPFRFSWDNIEPVHRRWNEINKQEAQNLRELFIEIRDGYCQSLEHVYKMFYDVIVREQHP